MFLKRKGREELEEERDGVIGREESTSRTW